MPIKILNNSFLTFLNTIRNICLICLNSSHKGKKMILLLNRIIAFYSIRVINQRYFQFYKVSLIKIDYHIFLTNFKSSH
jgi:hypothetical protein